MHDFVLYSGRQESEKIMKKIILNVFVAFTLIASAAHAGSPRGEDFQKNLRTAISDLDFLRNLEKQGSIDHSELCKRVEMQLTGIIAPVYNTNENATSSYDDFQVFKKTTLEKLAAGGSVDDLMAVYHDAQKSGGFSEASADEQGSDRHGVINE